MQNTSKQVEKAVTSTCNAGWRPAFDPQSRLSNMLQQVAIGMFRPVQAALLTHSYFRDHILLSAAPHCSPSLIAITYVV
jgi:hypothetical protein